MQVVKTSSLIGRSEMGRGAHHRLEENIANHISDNGLVLTVLFYQQ